jgi:hypothetical protein
MNTLRRYSVSVSVLAIAAMLVLFSSMGYGQGTTATLVGTVSDKSGAVVPGAAVTLKNDVSGDVRRTVSNGEGYFTFAAIPAGKYTVSVEAKGFKSWNATGVVLEAGDSRNVRGIALEPGAANEVITVEASSEPITPIDSGEKSATITEHILQNVAIQGQNAGEFIKILPGMAMTGGVSNTASFGGAGYDARTGGGPVGSFSANGGRVGSIDITSDGADIVDPGCNCGQAMNTNTEMTSELKVMTSNYGADQAKGPTVIETLSKHGGQQFHGEAYFYARNFNLDANDWVNNKAGLDPATGKQIAPRPQTHYYFPGAQLSGPLTPGRNKLFFFGAFQIYRQVVDVGTYHADVPTQAMRGGDFSDAAYLSSLAGGDIRNVPTGTGWTNGVYSGPPDPTGTGPALINTYPLPNIANPASEQGYNYINAATRFSNFWQARGSVDYNINDSTKLFVSYNRENDNAVNSLDVLWDSNVASWTSPTTPYPTPLVEKTRSDVITTNLTKVFSPTLTNELLFTYTYLNLPNSFQDRKKVERGSLGINYNLIFNHPNPQNMIFPRLTGWGNGISNMLNTGFELNGTVYAKKTLPSIADNMTKVWKTHTTKFGFFWERVWNSQPGNGDVNGSSSYAAWGGPSGNAYANMLLGVPAQYGEQNFDPVPKFRFLQEDFYGQDSWKVSRRVTLDYGVRVSHLGPWVDNTGFGFAAWYPNLYALDQGGAVTPPGTTTPVTFPGMEWHKVNPATPLSGSKSRMFFYNPHAGFAWDVFGTGRTILRGGYGLYRFHDEQNVQNGAYGITQGSFATPDFCCGVPFSTVGPSLLTGGLALPSALVALDPTDDKEPRTQNYSFTVAERTPWKSVLEVAYVGSKSDYLSNYNNNFDQLNYLKTGVLLSQSGWLPNCYPSGQPTDGGACAANGANTGYTTGQQNSARPLVQGACVAAGNCLGGVKLIDHKMYSNYNSLQVTWNKQSGPLTFLTNYTFSKALGIRGENGAATGDPTTLRNNYGTLTNDRTHIFNVAYVYQFPTLHSASGFVKGAANGWQISGIAQYQTGSDLQASVTSNFNYRAYIPAGTTFMGETIAAPILATNQNVLGTPDVNLMPKVICNPRSGLAAHQYVNGNCFAGFATPGQQGTYVFPTLHGPGFFNTDLSVFKNFTFGQSENKKLQFRISGYNFLNHPVNSFVPGDSALNLMFDPNTGQLLPPAPGVTFGKTEFKTGHRIMQGLVKFTW